MYATHIRCLASVFLEADGITATGDAFRGLLQRFGDAQVIPFPFQEMSPGGMRDRLGFISSGRDWQLMLKGSRFDVTQSPLVPLGGLLDVAAFCERAARYLAGSLEHFGRRGHRLAFVQEGVLNEGTPKDSLRERLLRLPPMFERTPPFEWDYRIASRLQRTFGATTEDTNTILIVKRFGGTFHRSGQSVDAPEVDRIRLDLDINTSPDQREERFGADDLREFFAASPSWHRALEEEAEAFLLGRERDSDG